MKPVNLLPEDQRRRRPTGDGSGKGAYAVLGVLAVLLAMVAAYVLTANQITERENEAAAVSAEADELQAQAAADASFTDFAQIAQLRTQAVANVANTRFDWERFMRELSLIMPAGSWLQTTDASTTGATVDPGDPDAGTTTTTAAAAGPTANLVGCTPDQDDVARMMVRLRQASRVTDVVLNESSRAQDGEEPSVDNCGRLYQFNLTVTFSPAEPGREAPRGERGVPASLGGGS